MALKEPVVALFISPDRNSRNQVHRHEKEITIREGHRDYRVGQVLMLCCHLDPWCVMADIASVRHRLAREVTLQECLDDGFTDVDDMIQKMRRYYPTFNPSTEVTVIRWANARGYWVDHADEYEV